MACIISDLKNTPKFSGFRRVFITDVVCAHFMSAEFLLRSHLLTRLAGRGLMLRTAEMSPQFRLYNYLHILKKLVPFMICVHILQGIAVYFYTPLDLVD